jgi:hypothetical protein
MFETHMGRNFGSTTFGYKFFPGDRIFFSKNVLKKFFLGLGQNLYKYKYGTK